MSRSKELNDIAQQLGLRNAVFHWVMSSAAFADEVLGDAKRVATLLKKSIANLGHMQSLECVSRACGFANWHAMRTLAMRVAEVPNRVDGSLIEPEVGAAYVFMLAGALPMLSRPYSAMAPDNDERHGMLRFARSLAAQAGIPEADALDLQARRFGSTSWDALCSREPQDQSGTLYTFRTWIEGRGRVHGAFSWTSLCNAMVIHQDELFQQYDERSSAEQKKARARVKSILSKHEDFLEGWLAWGTMLRLDGADPKSVRAAVLEGVERAEMLIPKDGVRNYLIAGTTT